MKTIVHLFYITFKNNWGHSYDFLLSDHSNTFLFHMLKTTLIEKKISAYVFENKRPLIYIIFKNNWGHTYDFLLSDHSKYSKQLPAWFKKLDLKKHPSENRP